MGNNISRPIKILESERRFRTPRDFHNEYRRFREQFRGRPSNRELIHFSEFTRVRRDDPDRETGNFSLNPVGSLNFD